MKKIFTVTIYWILQLTWGLLMNILGIIILFFCFIFGRIRKVHKNGPSLIFETPGNWGGLELGVLSLCGGYTTTNIDNYWFEKTRRHEFGHSIQNIIFGPLFIFIVWIPSALRYWYRMLFPKRIKTGYDDIWFEGMATDIGTRCIDKYEE